MLTLSVQRRAGIKRISKAWALQAVMSGTVMIALHAGTRLDFGFPGVDGSVMADAGVHREMRRDYPALPSLPFSPSDMKPGSAVAAPVSALPVGEAGKTSRLEKPALLAAQERVAVAKAAASASAVGVELASLEAARGEGVLLFDQCRPACESRDPLLLLQAGDERQGDASPAVVRIDPPVAPSATGPVMSSIDGRESVAAATPERPDGLIGTLSSRWSTARVSTETMLGNVTRLVRW